MCRLRGTGELLTAVVPFVTRGLGEDRYGGMELDRRGAGPLFQVLTECEKKNSVVIASSESFSGWTKTFTDPPLSAAIGDRLIFDGAIIRTGTESYRLARTTAQAQHTAVG